MLSNKFLNLFDFKIVNKQALSVSNIIVKNIKLTMLMEVRWMTKDFTEKKSDKECTLIVASDKKMNKDR